MRICHTSDTHGGFPKLHGPYDIVVHSGDFFPNSHALYNNGDKQAEATFQSEWLCLNIRNMKKWLQESPFLFVLGNHDFMNPDAMESLLRTEGITAINLTDKIITYDNVNFYGFPYIPYISGDWNYEREIPEMQVEVDKMVTELNNKYVDVLVCHAPIHGTLDKTWGNEVVGSSVIANALDYKISKDTMPSYYLHGHIHEAHGIAIRNNILVSNAGTTQHLLEI
jgi:Icc-related predicted phosphoesterase